VSRAVELGADRQEILEATAVALAVGGGLAQWPARFVFKVLQDLGSPAQSVEKAEDAVTGDDR
jgi:alkylhydroperoxidase/carboxymuconolactone decarboxylase family protein YurZ